MSEPQLYYFTRTHNPHVAAKQTVLFYGEGRVMSSYLKTGCKQLLQRREFGMSYTDNATRARDFRATMWARQRGMLPLEDYVSLIQELKGRDAFVAPREG